jgi:DNA-binding CsgD family transcriptional regulator
VATVNPTIRSGDAVFSFDRDLKIRSWNHQAELLTGMPADTVVGRPCWEALAAIDENGALVCHSGCSCARLAREGWPVPRKTLLVKTLDNSRRPLSVSTICINHLDDELYLHVLEPTMPALTLPQPTRVGLTPRQREVLTLVADGYSARQIARRLGLAEPTVRNHIRAILVELRVHSQLAAVARARKLGLVA